VEPTLSSNPSEEMLEHSNLLLMPFQRQSSLFNGKTSPLILRLLVHQPIFKSSPPMPDGSNFSNTKVNSSRTLVEKLLKFKEIQTLKAAMFKFKTRTMEPDRNGQLSTPMN